MPTIVRLIEDSRRYLLLGTGYGTFESAKPHWLVGDLGYERRGADHSLACLCDANGKLYWANSDDLIVESVDGLSPRDALSDPPEV